MKQKPLGQVALEFHEREAMQWLRFSWKEMTPDEKNRWGNIAKAVIREYLKRQKQKKGKKK